MSDTANTHTTTTTSNKDQCRKGPHVPLELEYPLVRSSFDSVVRVVRSAQKDVEKELGNLEKGVGIVQRNKETDITREKAHKFLNVFEQRLGGVKRKLDEADARCVERMSIMSKRLCHLQTNTGKNFDRLEKPTNEEGSIASASASTAGDDDQMVTTEDAGDEEDGAMQVEDKAAVDPAAATAAASGTASAEDVSMSDAVSAVESHDEDDNSKYAERQWNGMRVDRIIVDYMLRCGHYRAATQLATRCNICDLVDIELFTKSQAIVDSLRRKRCTEALEWCAENRGRLRKIKSNLEFNLRLQEFIELVRSGQAMDAIKYARKHLTSSSADNMSEIKRAMTLLAFGHFTTVSPYRELFDASRWDELIQQFQRSNYRICSLTMAPLLHINIMAGISALKVPQAFVTEHYNVNDPLCHQEFQKLSENLPFASHVHSKIVCRITGDLMDDDNPPMVLPNGNVYSLEAMQSMAAKHDGKIVDPRTGDSFRFDELKKSIII